MPSSFSLVLCVSLALSSFANGAILNPAAKLVGGHSSISDVSAPEIVAAGVAVARHFDSTSSSRLNVASFARVTSGTKQVVSGMKYEIEVELSPTACARDAADESCTSVGPPFCVVKANVWSQPWLKKNTVSLLSEACK